MDREQFNEFFSFNSVTELYDKLLKSPEKIDQTVLCSIRDINTTLVLLSTALISKPVFCFCATIWLRLVLLNSPLRIALRIQNIGYI